jgi:hypothetical protein
MRTGRSPGRAALAGIGLLLVIGTTTSGAAIARHQTSRSTGERIFAGQAVEENETNAAPEKEAYFTVRVRRARPPRGNSSGWVDDDGDDDGPRRARATSGALVTTR